MGVSADLFAADYSGAPTPLGDSFQRTWQVQRSAPGVFSFRLQNDDESLALCDWRRIVRFSIDDVVTFPGIIEARTVHAIDQGEEPEEYTEVKGRGTMGLYDSLIVYPELPDSPLIGDTRYFNAASTLFDDSGWATVDAVDLDTAEQGPPANWPAGSTAKKIRPGGSPTVDRDPEEFWTRKWFTTTGGDKTYRMVFTGDDGTDVFTDAVRIVQEVRPRMWQETRQADVRLRDGDHLVAIKGTNIDFPGDNYSWVAWALYEVDPDGVLGALVVQTDDTWVGIQCGDTPPGFTVGAVLEILSDEAEARGVTVPALGSTGLVDSAAAAWPVSPDIAFAVGLKGVPVLAQMAATYADFRMARDVLRLDAWAFTTMGEPSATSLHPPTDEDDPLTGNITHLEHEQAA